MIITILSIVLLVAGLVVLYIEDKGCYDSFLLFLGNAMMIVIGFIATLICIIAVLDVQVNKEVHYQNALYQKEMIEYRIDNVDKNIVGNELLYNDIVGYNNDLRFIKKWSDSYWTNWFFNEDIATIDYIELDME